MDLQQFYRGDALCAYQYFSPQPVDNGGFRFRVFAPAADRVSLMLDGRELPMHGAYDGNFYELQVPDAKVGDTYEYRIYHGGGYRDHADPYGVAMELRPDHKSVIADLSKYGWKDSKWMEQRSAMTDRPLNIYEMHAGSWRTKEDGSWYRYDELAPILVPYLKKSGYNYVELMPLAEHPLDASWGYQPTGFFSATSRYGTPLELMAFIDELHANNIGVLLDFVPVHFARDAYGLGRFDGTALYEYPNDDVGSSEWGSYNFMHSRGEVRSFLKSAANFWLKEYHFDGLRMDAISRIIYWQGNEQRGVNGLGVDFLKTMNRDLKQQNPGCMLIAEDSTSYGGVTRPVSDGGLGFDYKWDMGWMHDTLEYFQTDPEYRARDYNKLTFSMLYYPNERYLLPFSHDEVVHGKATILQKMNGQYDVKFPQGRAMYMYMMIHPGKKLSFMGNEFGQLREWDEKREQDWDMLKYPTHDSFYHYMCELNHLYMEHPAFYEKDYATEGYRWLDCQAGELCVYCMERRAESDRIIGVFNFSDRKHEKYTVAVPDAKELNVLLYTDWERFGGTTPEGEEQAEIANGSLVCTLAPFSGMLFAEAE